MQPFSLMLGLGALTGLILSSWRAPQKERLRYLDASVWAMLGALLGSRAATVIVNWGYYQSHLSEVYQVWLGGLSGIGAFIGALLAIFILARLWKIPPGILADVILPLAGTLAVTAWLGCWVDRCAYGWQSTAWWALPGRDEWGVVANRVPVQLIGAVSTLLIIWLIDRAGRHLRLAGINASIGLFGMSAVVFALSYLRADPTPIWNGLRLEAWGALALMVFSSVVVVVLLLLRKSKD